MSQIHLDFWHKALFVCYSLFIFSSTFSIALAQSSLGIALLFFLIIVIKDHHRIFIRPLRWFYIFIGLYIFWLLFTSAMAEKSLESMLSTKEEWLFFIVPIGIYLFQFEKLGKWLLTVFLSGIFLVSLYGIIQHFSGVHWFKSETLNTVTDGSVRISGNFSHPLTFGNYFVTAATFFIGYAISKMKDMTVGRRLFIFGVVVICLIAIMFTYSRGAVLAAVLTLLFLGLILKRKYFWPVLAVVFVFIILAFSLPVLKERYTENLPNDFSLERQEGRVYIWSKALLIIRDNPVFGVGQGGFGKAYLKYLPPDSPWWRKYPHAHNDYLQIMAISGIPGLFIFGGLWVIVFRLLWRGYYRSDFSDEKRRLCLAALLGSAAFFVTSLTECTFGDEEVRQMLMFVWGAGLSVYYVSDRQFKKPEDKVS